MSHIFHRLLTGKVTSARYVAVVKRAVDMSQRKDPKTVEVVIPKDPWIRISVNGNVVYDPTTHAEHDEDER